MSWICESLRVKFPGATRPGYGNNGILRQAITGLGLSYVAAVQSTTKVRPVCGDPKPPRVSVEALALSLPKRDWRTVVWREGTNVKRGRASPE
jgi:hypothetical protein